MILWWIADFVLLLGVGPVALFLIVRIFRGLTACHSALVNISGTTAALPGLIQPALSEVSGVIQAAESLLPSKSPATR
jgi:hypothetical protein